MSLVSANSSSVWFKKKITVAAGQTVKIDSFPSNSFLRVHYYVAFRNSSGTVVKVLDYDAYKVNGAIVDRVYSKSGSSVDYSISSSLVSGSLELQLVNNESFDLSVGFARILIDA